MNNIRILDCTLRDGGYVNDWNFGLEVAQSLIGSLVSSHVDYIELGFLRDCNYNPNKTLFNSLSEAQKLIPKNTGNTKFMLMALHDQYSLDKLEPNDGSVYAIRVTFHNYDIAEGLAYISRLMQKGYRVFCNPIHIMGYSENEFLNLIDQVNEIKPYAFSIVDTFGAMRTRDLMKYLLLCESRLDKRIAIGCHLHENMSLALSLAELFVKNVSPNRECIIDASLYGMGRVPGNLCIELIANYLNEVNDEEHYKIEGIIEAIDNHITHIKAVSPWGYAPEYFLSAKHNLHRNYAEHFYSQGNITYKTINHLLAKIPEEKKASFDKTFADHLLREAFAVDADDMSALKELISAGKKVLVIAPGISIVTDQSRIRDFINTNDTVVFCVNFISDLYTDANVFFGNEKRYAEYTSQTERFAGKLLVTSNILSVKEKEIRLDYSKAARGFIQGLNSVLMLINLLYRAGVIEIWLAGVDGYASSNENYLNKLFENRAVLQYAAEKNDRMLQNLQDAQREIRIHFITASIYQKHMEDNS